jgi:hypothetical protein
MIGKNTPMIADWEINTKLTIANQISLLIQILQA